MSPRWRNPSTIDSTLKMKLKANEKSVRWRKVDGEAVLINVDTTYYYSLNRTGTIIWELLLKESHDAEEIVSFVAERFRAEADKVREDVQALLGQLRDEGLVLEAD